MAARLIAIGRKQAAYHTVDVTFSSRDPEWKPQSTPLTRSERRFPKPDQDDVRKQRLEGDEDL